ncbi:hypothetical protein ON010_g9417 [Phytophthora cinnamomi]|nr:hypothetical protein ON010_g9417 [Phytophthora cinnamomi]
MGHHYTAAEMRHMLAHTGLFQPLESDPILGFIKPKLMSEFTGSFLAPYFDSLTSVIRAAPTLFEMLRESGFVLGAFEMEKVYDWNLEAWTRTIRGVLEPRTIIARRRPVRDGPGSNVGDDAVTSASIPVERGL